MRDFGRATGNQMVAINRLGRIGAVLTQLAIARVGRGQLSRGAIFQILDLVRNERRPSGLKSHVVGRHGEGIAARKSGGVVQTRNGPASELVVLTRGLMPHGLSRTFRRRVHRGIGAAPGSTVQVVNNLIATDILGIEVRGIIHRIRERRWLREGLVEIPVRERIGDAVYLFGDRKVGRIYISRLGLVTLHIVLRSQLGKLSAPRIAQVVLDKHNILALDGNIAVKVFVRIGTVVLGDFRRNKRNLFDIILGNFNTRKLRLNDRLVVLVNLVPGIRVPGHNIGAVGPRNYTLVDVVKAVLIIGPRRTSNIDGCNAVLGTPVSRIVGVCVLRRVKQIVHAGLIRRLSNGLDRDVLRRDHRRTIGIDKREAHRCGALAKARNQTALINGQNLLVGGSPRGGAIRIGRIGHSSQLKRGELSYRALARNRNARDGRGGDNVNRVGVFTRPNEEGNRIGDNCIAHGNTSYSRGGTIAYNSSDSFVVARPSMRVSIIGTGQRNRLTDRDCLFCDKGRSIDVCVTVARFGNGGGTIGVSGSVARGGVALGRGRDALAGCDGVGRALVGLRLVGRSLGDILALRGIAGGRDYFRSRGRLRLRGGGNFNLNGNVRVESCFIYGIESLRVRMELSFLAVDQGLYGFKVIASHGCNAKDKRCMHRHGDRLCGCRKGLTVVVQSGVGNINPNVYLAICFRLSSGLLSGGLVSGSLLGSGLLGGGLVSGSLLSSGLLGSSALSLGSCGSLSFSSSLRLIGGLRLVDRLVARCRLLLLSLRLVHLPYGLLSVLRCNGLCQGTGSTRRPHGKDQQRRHCCRNDPL